MDFITHLLAAGVVGAYIKLEKRQFVSLTIASVFPDLGEIVIQQKLNSKYNQDFGVYDLRTSDLTIASDLPITSLYDILHSVFLPTTLMLIYLLLIRNKKLILLKPIALGLSIHILLDSFTHGKVWALKLIYPLSNKRFEIFSDTVGNWWDWQPKIRLNIIELPLLCFIIWSILIGSFIIISNKNKVRNSKST